jgi:RNA polymerase-binding transcription factor DksA
MDIEKIRERLLLKRVEIFNRRKLIDESWQNLRGQEVEVEERAQSEKMTFGLENLDTRATAGINAIDEALKKLEIGTYGLCNSCGGQISMERLDAIPWTGLCSSCARGVEALEFFDVNEDVPTERFSEKFQGMTDDEITDAIYERLQRHGRIELEELDVSFHKGTAILRGLLPSRMQHEILTYLLEDKMGIQDIEDNIQIDRQIWQGRADSYAEEQKQSDEEAVLYGEGVDEEILKSMKQGTPSEPPDEIIPEK